MNLRLIASTVVISAALVACGGGGSTGGNVPPATNAPTPTAAQTTTNASGTVVDDGTGNPLAGVAVKLMPWVPCGATPVPATSITPENDGCPTPLPSPQATTASNGTFTLNGVPNGHYLLIIGADTVSTPPAGYAPPSCTVNCGTPTPAPFTVRATVHDNVTLTGGNQTLVAPTLPTVPSGYTPPMWETNGDYRLATLDAAKEMPCYIAWQYERAQHGLAGSSVDEWLTENIRANILYIVAHDGGTLVPLSTGGGSDTGGTDCYNSNLVAQFAPGASSYAVNARTLSFGGEWSLYETAGTSFYQGVGFTELPIDPRSFTDPNFPNWP
ncbi:MAG: hypothetical protein WBD74_05000 [Candidatus Aquilonibacter sp.]